MKRILITLAALAVAAVLTLGAGPASAQYLEDGGAGGAGGGGTEQAGGAGGAGTGVGGTGGQLARTGSSNVLPLVGVGGAALLLGGAFLYGARKPNEA